MAFINIFLVSLTFMLGLASLVVLYLMMKRSKDPTILPVFYFIGLSFFSVLVLSGSRLFQVLGFSGAVTAHLVRDLAGSYVVLFLFGALWQSYEASVVEKPDWLD